MNNESAHEFFELDVFSQQPMKGNPLAVVADANRLSAYTMGSFAAWTNFSETTFLLTPTNPQADYRVRIFTPAAELPFAGHPTLGSCYAWLSLGNKPLSSHVIVQECGLGLIHIRKENDAFYFRAPSLIKKGALDDDLLEKICAALSIPVTDVEAHAWVDNGPGWCAILLRSAEQVCALKPNFSLLHGIHLGVAGPRHESPECDFEVRAFVPSLGVPEDPVTGSLNAGIAQWFFSQKIVTKDAYVVSQGTALNRAGRVYVQKQGVDIWVGGHCSLRVKGTVFF